MKGGAGLEIDLSDPRRREDLPSELRGALPAQGIVNIVEARAIIEAVEAMSGDPAFHPGSESVGAGPTVAVMSVFPAQVTLLRLLLDRSQVLAGSSLKVEIGLPGSFHQRERRSCWSVSHAATPAAPCRSATRRTRCCWP